MEMEIFNNTTKTVGDDIKAIVRPGDKLSIAAACFSIYAYQELREQLESCEELRFIFTSPTFIAEKTKAERREFYIPQSRQRTQPLWYRIRGAAQKRAETKGCRQRMC